VVVSELKPAQAETEPDETGGSASLTSLDEPEALELRAHVAGVVRELVTATAGRQLEIIDGLTTTGLHAQPAAASEFTLLETRVGTLLNDRGAAGRVAKDLTELRVVLAQLDPTGTGLVRRVQTALPNGLLRRLERIAARYETASHQVMVIERRLREGAALLRRDNIELRQMFADIEGRQASVEREVFVGEAIVLELQALLETTSEAARRQRIQSALFDVTVRVQDLHALREVHAQFFAAIELTRVNNSRLGQAVERTLSLVRQALIVGLAIQSALTRQRRVLQATEQTRQFLGDLMVANAESIKRQATQIGDAYRNPAIALEKLSRAHHDLVDAIEATTRLEAEGIELARASGQQLRELAMDLAARTSVLAPASSGGRPPELEGGGR